VAAAYVYNYTALVWQKRASYKNMKCQKTQKTVCCIAFWNNVKRLNIICMTLIAI